MMRGPAAVALAILTGLCPTVVAVADVDGVAVNGTFTAVSDGQWAQTNESYHDEATVTATWTITSTCTTYQDCTGTIVSDQGWTAELRYTSGNWHAARTVAAWAHCADGTVAPGHQAFVFWPARADDYHANSLVGWDETVGPSGGCGVNRALSIRMPLRLNRTG